MAVIENTIATGGEAFKANRDGMLGLIARMRSISASMPSRLALKASPEVAMVLSMTAMN